MTEPEPAHFCEIDELTRGDHPYLRKEDRCFYLKAYTPRMGFSHSETNDVISNLKKTVDKRGLPQWKYKEQAVQKVARQWREVLNVVWLRYATLVPVPPSMTKEDPLYDDRVHAILRTLDGGNGFDVRELVCQKRSMKPDHLGDDRLTPQQYRELLVIDESLATATPREIGVFDDVLCTGKHFVAIKGLLQERFPGVSVMGFFYARTERLAGDSCS